eukprot:PITA_24812
MMGSVWYLDSGTSFHMIGDKELLSNMEDKYLHMHVEMGDNGKYSVTGLGTFTFQSENGAPLILNNVMYVHRLKKDLVSVSMLEDRVYDVIFSKGKAFLRHIAMGQVKKIGIRVKNLYKLEVEECDALRTKAESVQIQDVGELWHRRLGHLHHGALKIIQHISASIPKGTLEQKRDQTFTKFCEFKALVEKESGKKVKALWTNNGGEYVSNEFKNFCVAKGIKRELAEPRNPYQNGVARRKNKSIVGAKRVMLHDQGITLHLWVEACNTTVYVKNRTHIEYLR